MTNDNTNITAEPHSLADNLIDGDPYANTRCQWPRCPLRGNPYEDTGWRWWPRYYLWLPEGFYCRFHTRWMKQGIRSGHFKDWPRDMSPGVLELNEVIARFAPVDSEAGQHIIRQIDAEARRAAFHVVHVHAASEESNG